MSRQSKFLSVLENLREAYERLDDDDDRSDLEAILRDVATLASSPEPGQLRTIVDYTSRKLRMSRSSMIAEGSLRALRNTFVHQGRAQLLPSQLRKYSSTLWRVLGNSASEWDRLKLFNVLSYCIGPTSIRFDPQYAEAAQLIKTYKSAYVKLDEVRQERAFRELIIRLYSDPESRRILERSEEEQ